MAEFNLSGSYSFGERTGVLLIILTGLHPSLMSVEFNSGAQLAENQGCSCVT